MLIVFAKYSILNAWQGSEYASGWLKMFCYGSRGYLGEFDVS